MTGILCNLQCIAGIILSLIQVNKYRQGICYFVKADIVGQFHLHILAQLMSSVLTLLHDCEVRVCM